MPLIREGLPLVPPKLVAMIIHGEFVEMHKLLQHALESEWKPVVHTKVSLLGQTMLVGYQGVGPVFFMLCWSGGS